MMEVDELPDTDTWDGWIVSWFVKPSPKLEIELKKRELTRRILRLNVQVNLYERQRLSAVRKLDQAVKGRSTERRLKLIGNEIANYENLQDACAYSIVKYQEGILTLEKLDQMRQTTTDFAEITKQLAKMNKSLGLRKTATMARNYERNMDIMEQKEETMSELIVERHDTDAEGKARADQYIQKARAKAGLDAEVSMPAPSRRPTESQASSSSSSSSSSTMNNEDEAMLKRVMEL
jgi:hypothetical protein